MRSFSSFKSFYILILLFSGSTVLFGQFSGVSLTEVQLGKLPNESDEAFPSLYDRTEINFRYDEFTAGITIEDYFTEYDDRNYFDLSQASLVFKKKKWDIKLGNIYETLGRGLLLRSFEIPGALIEDIGFRSRTYFHRDLLGLSLKYKTKKATVHVLRADALNNVLPPTFARKDRRVDLVNAVSAKLEYYKKHKVGGILMNHQTAGQGDENLTSGFLEGPITKALNYYLEYATNVSETDRYAFYTGINGYSGSLSFSLEYKRYNDFIIGAGINEPPALIKEHTYKVLNRSTHVTNPLNEEGYQIDIFYTLKDGSSLNFNHAIAVNRFGGRNHVFQEYFAEYTGAIKEVNDYKIFLDYSEDPFKGQSNRISGGLYADIRLNETMRLLPELEFQRFDRSDMGVSNLIFSLGLNVDSKIFISILAEVTNDPFIVRDGQTNRLYLGNTIRYKPNYKNTFQLFFGQRRGGPLCSAGVCYEILDFKGMEIRWTTRFKTN